MRQFDSQRLIYLLPIFMLVLLLVGAYRSHIVIEKITDPTQIALPQNVKQRLLTETDSELMYVAYHDKKLDYYFISKNEIRCKIILQTMQKLITSFRYTFKEGNYLLVLHDGAHHTYGYPVLAYATKQQYLDTREVILIPDPYATLGYKDVFRDLDRKINKFKWPNKTAKIFWRGSAFGVGPECNDLDGCDRFKFMNLAANLSFADVGFTSYTSQLNPIFKGRLAARHSLKAKVNPVDSMQFKYLIDVDGNSCSYSRMAWILYSNSVLMKHQSDLMQWYYPQLKPYVHYLPVKADFSDLETQFLWAEANQKQAKAIAENGRRFAKKVFSKAMILNSMEQAFVQYQDVVQTHN